MSMFESKDKAIIHYPIIGNIDRVIFWPAVISLLVLLAIALTLTDKANTMLLGLQNYFCISWGWFINALVGINFFYIIYIGLSRFGNIKLGKDTDNPEYNTLSWICMLFSAGVGIGYVCFGVAEPMWHSFTATTIKRLGIAGTPEAFPLGIQSAIMDWGATCWALFALGGLAIALPCYRKNLPMTVGTSLYGLSGDKHRTSIWVKLTDVIGIIAAICGNSAALGMGVLSICWVINYLFGIETTIGLKVFIAFAILLLYIISTATGLNRGLKYLSLTNVVVASLLCLYVLITGPTTYILNIITEEIGLTITHLIPQAFFSDAGSIEQDSWLYWWPIFYWLWWISYIPFVGGFVARISRGRTIRQFVFGVTFIPVGMALIWFSVFGGAGSWAQFVDGIQIWQVMEAQGSEPAIWTLLSSYPLGTIICIIALISLICFTVTTSDAASFYISLQCSGQSDGSAVLGARLLWALLLGSFASILIFLGGTDAMTTLKGFTIAGATPFCIITILMEISLWKMLKKIENGEM